MMPYKEMKKGASTGQRETGCPCMVTRGLLLLLSMVVFINAHNKYSCTYAKDIPCKVKVFVEIGGDVKNPGVYGFLRLPYLHDLIKSAGGLAAENLSIPKGISCPDGSSFLVKVKGNALTVTSKDMSAFYKITLGIPIDINRETAYGLTALPGIGPVTARAIVKKREEMGGFERKHDILTVKGIGPGLYKKISPYIRVTP